MISSTSPQIPLIYQESRRGSNAGNTLVKKPPLIGSFVLRNETKGEN